MYSINVVTGATTSLQPLPTPTDSDLRLAMCGLATKEDGSRLVVLTGGFFDGTQTQAVSDTYVYEVDGDGVWVPGPPLPDGGRTWGRAVQSGGTFLLVGGSSRGSLDGDMRGEILRYRPDEDEWEELPQVLEEPSVVRVALVAPKNFNVTCA